MNKELGFDEDQMGDQTSKYYNLDQLVEITLKAPRDFLRVKETLTRMGDQQEGKILEQICYIFHKKDRYFIAHINEMRKLDGETAWVTEEDISKRNLVVQLLVEWNLVSVEDPKTIRFPVASLSEVRVIPYRDKDNWNLVSNYDIGRFSSRE